MTTEQIRKRLKNIYTSFLKQFGQLNKSRNKNIINKDAYGLLVLSSLEVRMGNDYTEAELLTKAPEKEEEYQTDDVKEALAYVLGMTGKVDMQLISDVCDMDIDQIIAELGDEILYNPISGQWETSAQVLSGNVWDKLCKVEEYLGNIKQEITQ